MGVFFTPLHRDRLTCVLPSGIFLFTFQKGAFELTGWSYFSRDGLCPLIKAAFGAYVECLVPEVRSRLCSIL